MATSKVELEIVKQLFSTLSDNDKKSFLKSIKNKEKLKQNFIFSKELKECPHCKSTHFVKNGKVQGRQRFICMDCHKTFANTNNTIFFGVKKDLSVWEKYIHCMIKKYSLRKTAKICNISLPTAFTWRHKILDALQEIQENVKLDGVVEVDKTFLPISCNGHHKDFNFPRLAKKRGTANSKRGLPKELVCIPCIVNLNGRSVARIANLGKSNVKALNSVINGKEKDSIFVVTDSLRSYLKLCNKHFNIQVINSCHSVLKTMPIYTFKGVSMKYFNNYILYNYILYHNFVNFAKESRKDKKLILLNHHIVNTDYISKNVSVADRPEIPLPCVA